MYPPPRSLNPHTVFNASTTADFPQLFGPTNRVTPAAGSITVLEWDM
jgi:hypothetical protein